MLEPKKESLSKTMRVIDIDGTKWYHGDDLAVLLEGLGGLKSTKTKPIKEPVEITEKVVAKKPVSEEERPRIVMGVKEQDDDKEVDDSLFDRYFEKVKRTKKSEEILRTIYKSKKIGFEDLWTKLGKNPSYLWQWDADSFPCVKQLDTDDGTVYEWVEQQE